MIKAGISGVSLSGPRRTSKLDELVSKGVLRYSLPLGRRYLVQEHPYRASCSDNRIRALAWRIAEIFKRGLP